MNVQSIKKSTLVKVVCILSVIILFSSCATQTELNLGPTIDKPLFGVSFYILYVFKVNWTNFIVS